MNNERLETLFIESLILAQDERWRRVLGMQVERSSPSSQELELESGKRERNTLVTYPPHGHNLEKSGLIADGPPTSRGGG